MMRNLLGAGPHSCIPSASYGAVGAEILFVSFERVFCGQTFSRRSGQQVGSAVLPTRSGTLSYGKRTVPEPLTHKKFIVEGDGPL